MCFRLNRLLLLDDFSSFRMRFSGFLFHSPVQIIKRCGFVVYPTNGRTPRTNQYSLFRIVCDHVQFTWYTCSRGQIFNFFVALSLCGYTPVKHLRRAGPPGRDTHLTRPASPALRPPLRAHAWQTNTNTADRSPGVGRAHASSVLPLGRCTHRACDSILTPRSRSASVRDVCDGACACDALRVTVS